VKKKKAVRRAFEWNEERGFVVLRCQTFLQHECIMLSRRSSLAAADHWTLQVKKEKARPCCFHLFFQTTYGLIA